MTESKISYILDTFRHLYEVPDSVRIDYGTSRQEGKRVTVAANADSFFDKQKQKSPKEVIIKEWNGTDIPLLFEESSVPPLMEQKEYGVHIPYDILAASFYFLSGWQEYAGGHKDSLDRFPHRKSLQFALKSTHIPYVNYYFGLLKKAVEQTYGLQLSPQKGSAEFQLAITHDIDYLHSGWMEDSFHMLKRGRLPSFFRILAAKTSGTDSWFTLDEMRRLEEERAVTASYYFLCRSGRIDGIDHADYDITDPEIRKQIDKLSRAGFEIGLHGSSGTHTDYEKLTEDVNLLSRAVKGGRFHFLKFDMAGSPAVLQNTGFMYDSTLGFAEQPGFRNGFAHPFYLYDIEKDRRTDVLEIPLAVMDTSLQNPKYMGRKSEEAFGEIQKVVEEIRKFNGAAAILWHNNFFSDYKFGGWREVFTDILDYCEEHDGAAVSASEIVPYYSFG